MTLAEATSLLKTGLSSQPNSLVSSEKTLEMPVFEGLSTLFLSLS